MAKEDWPLVPAHQVEEVQQGQCVPRGQQGRGSQGDEEGLDKDSDKEDQRIKSFCIERDTKLFLHHTILCAGALIVTVKFYIIEMVESKYTLSPKSALV